MNRYNLCQRIKNQIKILVEKLRVNEVPEKPWIHLIVDFITKLLAVTEKDAILIIYDRLLKIAHFVAMTEGILAEGLVRF